MKRKTKVSILKATNREDCTGEDLDMAMNGKPKERIGISLDYQHKIMR